MARATLRIQLLLLMTGIALSCAATPETARSLKTPTSEAVVTTVEQREDSNQRAATGEPPEDLEVLVAPLPSGRRAWPLTGVATDAAGSWPALVTKIDNHDRARPQYGINSADVVFEEIVEGGLTRFAALFHSENPEIVGPIRSVRTSDFDLLRNLNQPLFANSGGNEAVLGLLKEIDFVDVSSNAAFDAYSRLDERPSPHNFVTNAVSLREAGSERGLGGTPPVFLQRESDDSNSVDPGSPVNGIDLDFGATQVSYRWNQGLSGWLRTQNGTPHVDAADIAVAPEIVIVQTISYRRSAADGRSPEAVLVGSGEALFLFEGRVMEGSWERNSAQDLTRYLDRQGETIQFPPGNTWIALARVGQVQIVEQ